MSAPEAGQCLQRVLWGDTRVPFDPALYVRAGGTIDPDGPLRLMPGAVVSFDTYVNIFPLALWRARCGLEHLALRVVGEGRVRLRVLALGAGSRETVLEERLTLDAGASHWLEIPLHDASAPLLAVDLVSETDAQVTSMVWETCQTPPRTPDLALVITLYNHPEGVAETARRFSDWQSETASAARCHLYVIDNTGAPPLPDLSHVTCLPNRNLGGSGGFARGLLEARARGHSHCLFMDDDAAWSFEAVARTQAYLAYAQDPHATVAGAMLSEAAPYRMEENSAVFDGAVRRRHRDVDLRDPDAVAAMLTDAAGPPPAGSYGGWWFFAFALAEVSHLPFPFFVRGDDISFCLSQDLGPVTLPGVAVLNADMGDKDSPLTWYLDARSQLINVLSLPCLARSRWQAARLAILFWGRAFLSCHYGRLAALVLAMRDVCAGPDTVSNTPDLGERRAQLAALGREERRVPMPEAPPDRRALNPQNRAIRVGLWLSLNGLLLPGFGAFGNRITLRLGARRRLVDHLGAAQITYRDPAEQVGYMLRHDKRRALMQSLRVFWEIARFVWRYWRIRAAWRSAYGPLTGEAFWRDALGLNSPK